MSLDGIAAEAQASLGDGTPREGEFIPAGGADPAAADRAKLEAETREWAGVPYILGGLLSKILPELKEVYTLQACMEWGGSMVPVARKYGWTMGGLELEAALLIATWSLLSPTVDALKRRRATNAKPQEKTETEKPAGEPGANLNAEAPAETHPDGSPQ